MVETGESQNPGVGVRWIHQRLKEELVLIAQEFGLDREGRLEDLRKRLCKFVQDGGHSPETWARLAEHEARFAKLLEPLAGCSKSHMGARLHQKSESDLRSVHLHDSQAAPTSQAVTQGSRVVPDIRVGSVHDPPVHRQFTARPPKGVAEQVRKWGMRYDGKADPLTFIETLEERAIAHGIDLERMPGVMSEVFVDRAARWFQTCGLRNHPWEDFRNGFLEFYLPPRYFERLEDQIRSRRQREGEEFKDYLIDLRALMHHAGYDVARELHRAYENAAPEYRFYIRRHDFTTLSQLTQMAAEYENVKGQSMEYSRTATTQSRNSARINPSQGNQEVSRPYNPFRSPPDAARPVEIGGGVPQFPVESSAATNRIMAQVGGPVFNPRRACHKCAQEGHFARECPNAQVTFCRRCGKRDVSSQNCCGRVEEGNGLWRPLRQGQGDANTPSTQL